MGNRPERRSKCLAPPDAEVSLMNIAKCGKTTNCGGQIRRRGQKYIDIDDRLGG
jgi:hypothetical protein